MLNNGQTEFVITTRQGFTRRLHEAARRKPSMRYRASIDGPYGITPNLASYNKLLTIAGGSGATFAMSLAQEWLRMTHPSDTSRSLHFVWVVRSACECKPSVIVRILLIDGGAHLQWLSDQLCSIKRHPRATVLLHVTGSDSATKELADGENTSGEVSPSLAGRSADSPSSVVSHSEKLTLQGTVRSEETVLQHRHSLLHHFFHRGRPVIDDIFARVQNDVQESDRLLVTGGCNEDACALS